MTFSYLDASAAMNLILEEPQSAALAAELAASADRRLVSSWLLHAELHCAAGHYPDDVDVNAVQQVLDTVTLLDVRRGDLLAAGTHAPLRSHDAIHLVVALRAGADEMITYDAELTAAARAAGLAIVAPAGSG